jgi:hemerythrin-like metal-binding protein
MPLIEWRQEFSLGVPDVDHEHRELIELINELYAHLQRQDSSVSVEDFLGEIYAKISAHFALEEKIMRERHYDQYDDHKADHERLLDEIRDIMDAYEDDAHFNESELAACLTAWFTEHFKTKDARLHKYLH